MDPDRARAVKPRQSTRIIENKLEMTTRDSRGMVARRLPETLKMPATMPLLHRRESDGRRSWRVVSLAGIGGCVPLLAAIPGRIPCGIYAGSREAGGRLRRARQQQMPICRDFTGATGLEPATSGVTGRVRHNDARRRVTQNEPICRCFSAQGRASSAWLSQSCNRRLGHEWATESCLHGQRAGSGRSPSLRARPRRQASRRRPPSGVASHRRASPAR
jgi:hypothetical protein